MLEHWQKAHPKYECGRCKVCNIDPANVNSHECVSALGLKVDTMEKSINSLKSDVSELKKEVKELKSEV